MYLEQLEEFKSAKDAYLQEQSPVTYNAFICIRDILFETYKDILCCLCAHVSLLNECIDELEKGIKPNMDYILEVSERVDILKDQFLEIKEALGYDDGLQFMADNKYFCGEIRDGRLIGEIDTEAIKTFANQWVPNHTFEDNNFRFENALFLYFMAHPEVLHPSTKKNTSIFEKAKRRVVSWISPHLSSCA